MVSWSHGHMEILPRYFLEIAFDGTRFSGWQNQPSDPSVQQAMEAALRTVLREPHINVTGCGRTDSGVHAEQFFLHFDASTPMDERLLHSLNSLLPESIAVKRFWSVADNAHARFDATERGYVFRVHHQKDPFLADRSYHFRPALDVEAMNAGCGYLIGKQDFTSFCKAGSDNKTMLCDVRKAEWRRTTVGEEFTIVADRFLRNMVRAIVGTCLRIGTGAEPPEHMRSVIKALDRSAAGKAAPACGLYLHRVSYPYIPQ